jgi:hypothetical protein
MPVRRRRPGRRAWTAPRPARRPDDWQVADPQLHRPVGGIGEFATDRSWRQWQPHRPDPTMTPRPISRRSVAASRQIIRCFFGHGRRRALAPHGIETGRDPSTTTRSAATKRRRVSLSEEDSAVLEGVGPRAALLGTLDARGRPVHLGWADPITEHPALGATEIWELHNCTADAHPIHIHEVQFQVVDRQPFQGLLGRRSAGSAATRTPSSPTQARSRESKPPSTRPACTCGTATSSSMKTTR